MTGDERTAIRLAAATYRWPAIRDEQVRVQLGMTPTRFWQYVGALSVRPDVVAAMPVECGRLVRLREGRRAERSGCLDASSEAVAPLLLHSDGTSHR